MLHVDGNGNKPLQNLSSPTFLLTLPPHRDQVVIHIRRPEETQLSSYRRIIWCPYIQDDNEDSQDATSQTLALLHEDMVWLRIYSSLLASPACFSTHLSSLPLKISAMLLLLFRWEGAAKCDTA